LGKEKLRLGLQKVLFEKNLTEILFNRRGVLKIFFLFKLRKNSKEFRLGTVDFCEAYERSER